MCISLKTVLQSLLFGKLFIEEKYEALCPIQKVVNRFLPKLDKIGGFRPIHLCFHYDVRRSKLYAT